MRKPAVGSHPGPRCQNTRHPTNPPCHPPQARQTAWWQGWRVDVESKTGLPLLPVWHRQQGGLRPVQALKRAGGGSGRGTAKRAAPRLKAANILPANPYTRTFPEPGPATYSTNVEAQKEKSNKNSQDAFSNSTNVELDAVSARPGRGHKTGSDRTRLNRGETRNYIAAGTRWLKAKSPRKKAGALSCTVMVGIESPRRLRIKCAIRA
jgi:hypothetical protein